MRATVDRAGLDRQSHSPVIKVRRVRKGDLSKVRDVVEQAFGDFYERQLGSRPRQVFGGAQYIHHRWLMEPWGCFVAEEGDGKIVGASVAVMWGPVGVVGPVVVLTPYQNQGIGQKLVKATQEFFAENKVTLQGLATYPNSAKHLVFYQKFDYRPRGLVVITSKPVDRRGPSQPSKPSKPQLQTRRYSTLEESKKKAALGKFHRISGGVYRGMDLTKEVEIVDGLALGDTLLLEKGRDLIGFAIYHVPGVSEAPQGSLYAKFVALDSRQKRPEYLHHLLGALEDLAQTAGLQRVIAPVYTSYWTAYRELLARGYQIDATMVRMTRGKSLDYENPADFVLDDWR